MRTVSEPMRQGVGVDGSELEDHGGRINSWNRTRSPSASNNDGTATDKRFEIGPEQVRRGVDDRYGRAPLSGSSRGAGRRSNLHTVKRGRVELGQARTWQGMKRPSFIDGEHGADDAGDERLHFAAQSR